MWVQMHVYVRHMRHRQAVSCFLVLALLIVAGCFTDMPRSWAYCSSLCLVDHRLEAQRPRMVAIYNTNLPGGQGPKAVCQTSRSALHVQRSLVQAFDGACAQFLRGGAGWVLNRLLALGEYVEVAQGGLSSTAALFTRPPSAFMTSSAKDFLFTPSRAEVLTTGVPVNRMHLAKIHGHVRPVGACAGRAVTHQLNSGEQLRFSTSYELGRFCYMCRGPFCLPGNLAAWSE